MKLKIPVLFDCTLFLQVDKRFVISEWEFERVNIGLCITLHFYILHLLQYFKPILSLTGPSTSQQIFTFINAIFTIPHFMNETVASESLLNLCKVFCHLLLWYLLLTRRCSTQIPLQRKTCCPAAKNAFGRELLQGLPWLQQATLSKVSPSQNSWPPATGQGQRIKMTILAQRITHWWTIMLQHSLLSCPRLCQVYMTLWLLPLLNPAFLLFCHRYYSLINVLHPNLYLNISFWMTNCWYLHKPLSLSLYPDPV